MLRKMHAPLAVGLDAGVQPRLLAFCPSSDVLAHQAHVFLGDQPCEEILFADRKARPPAAWPWYRSTGEETEHRDHTNDLDNLLVIPSACEGWRTFHRVAAFAPSAGQPRSRGGTFAGAERGLVW